MIKVSVITACLALGGMVGSASAATLSGTFTIDIYNFNSGGNSANAVATEANVTAHAGDLVKTIVYTGDLDFSSTGNNNTTIADFLDSGNGTYDDTGLVGITQSQKNYQATTIYVITRDNYTHGLSGIIEHDDGISVYDDGALVADSSDPTVEIETAFNFNGGDFKLIYSAANGNPEVLRVDVVPVPPAIALFGSGLLGLGMLAFRRKRRSADTAAA
jgi:hypothetical protein